MIPIGQLIFRLWCSALLLVPVQSCAFIGDQSVDIRFPDSGRDATFVHNFETRWTGAIKEFPIGVTGLSYSVPEETQNSLLMNRLNENSAARFLRAFSGTYERCYFISHSSKVDFRAMPTVFFFVRFTQEKSSAFVLNFKKNGELFTRPLEIEKKNDQFIFSNGPCYKRKLTPEELNVLSRNLDGHPEKVSFSRMLTSF